MKIPEEYMEQAKRADAFLEDALETAEKRFERAIKNLQQRTIGLAARLEQLPDGTMKGGRFALSQALALEPQLQELFEDTYGRAVAEQVKDFAKVVGIIRDQFQPMGLSESFLTGPTKDMRHSFSGRL